MSREKIQYPILLVLEGIVKQAERDGVITKEEADLIRKIQIDARELEKNITEYVRQYSPSKEELEDFISKEKEKLIKKATDLAMEDGIISPDEKGIIDRLVQELSKYSYF